MNVKSEKEMKSRVNGSQLAAHQGRTVCLLGTVVQIDPSGMNLKLKASDNQTVDVRLQEPVMHYTEGIVEVIGTVIGRNSISAFKSTCFPKEQASTFDMNLYNEATQLINKHPEFYPSYQGGAF